jgi:hypothetical protein
MKTPLKFLWIFLLIVAFVVSATPSLAVTIDFDSLENPTNTMFTVASPYVEDGFSISTASNFSSIGQGSSRYAGSAGLFVGSNLDMSVLTGPGVFDLLSIELSFLDPAGTSPPIVFTGNLSGGGSVSQTLQPIGFGFTQFNFNSSFTDLISVSWLNGDDTLNAHQFDNITVRGSSPIPEPATMLLFSAGLAGLGVFRKKFGKV